MSKDTACVGEIHPPTYPKNSIINVITKHRICTCNILGLELMPMIYQFVSGIVTYWHQKQTTIF